MKTTKKNTVNFIKASKKTQKQQELILQKSYKN